jgi:hypothetical protein
MVWCFLSPVSGDVFYEISKTGPSAADAVVLGVLFSDGR